MNDNPRIVSLVSVREKREQAEREANEAAAQVEIESLEESRQKQIEMDLKSIDELRLRVERGEATGVVLIARHLPTGLFLMDRPDGLHFQPEPEPGLTAMLYVGMLDQLRETFAVSASFCPVLKWNEDGTFETVNPMDEIEELLDE